MSSDPFDELLGLSEKQAPAAPTPAEPASAPARSMREEEDDREPDTYRPFVTRSPHPAFSVIEKDGKRHGFQYHALKHPQHEVRDGKEYLYFFGDGAYCVMQGTGLLPIFRALLRHTLW